MGNCGKLNSSVATVPVRSVIPSWNTLLKACFSGIRFMTYEGSRRFHLLKYLSEGQRSTEDPNLTDDMHRD